jgi:hypothetical protein
LWWRFYEKYQARLRPAIVENIISLLSCGLLIRGYALYHCSHSACLHTKKIAFRCKSRFCPTCGKKATDQWIATQQAVLPHTEWQHLTFTIPAQLWVLFQYNRVLLTQLSPLAAKTVQTVARQKHGLPGIFTALHTVGRDLKWNPHVHLSVTRGGLTDDHQAWKPLYFARHLIMPRWRYEIITRLRQTYARGELVLPPRLQAACPTLADWNHWLDPHYRKAWIVHFAKPHHHPQRNVNYLGRYLKRPPLALSRLKHYDGNTVVFAYLNHTHPTPSNRHPRRRGVHQTLCPADSRQRLSDAPLLRLPGPSGPRDLTPHGLPVTRATGKTNDSHSVPDVASAKLWPRPPAVHSLSIPAAISRRCHRPLIAATAALSPTPGLDETHPVRVSGVNTTGSIRLNIASVADGPALRGLWPSLTLILPAQRPALSAVNENSFASCHPPWAKSTLKFLYLKES